MSEVNKQELQNVANHIKAALDKPTPTIQDITTPMNLLRAMWRRYYGVE